MPSLTTHICNLGSCDIYYYDYLFHHSTFPLVDMTENAVAGDDPWYFGPLFALVNLYVMITMNCTRERYGIISKAAKSKHSYKAGLVQSLNLIMI